jgi:hypothetical protein
VSIADDAEAGGLAEILTERKQPGSDGGDKVAAGFGGARNVEQTLAESVFAALLDLGDRSLRLKGGEKSGDRRFRKVDLLCELGHPERPGGQGSEHGERSLDRLYGHARQGIPLRRTVPHGGTATVATLSGRR